jgi:hypoxanthine phosphoribosyltransferase
MSHTKPIEETFSADQIAARVTALAQQIRSDAGSSDIFLLGILKGTSCFLADLMRAIPGNVSYGFIDVVRDINDTDAANALEIDFISYTEIGGRNVYVLKDVVSTGVIENYLLMQLRMHEPKSLKLVALLDRPELRTVDLNADYKGFEVGDGAWVGYGLEIDAKYGNLPYIGKL